MERYRTKRQVKPAQNLINFDDLPESSDDSDFCIDDYCEEHSDDSIGSDISDASNDEKDSDENKANDTAVENGTATRTLLNDKSTDNLDEEVIRRNLVCSVCLGDKSDDANEIIECDGCGVTVHEACYGVQDNISLSSTTSSCTTEPWFCEACRAGVTNPSCELCPNQGGVLKETDVGKWVHLVCALYTPNIKFGEIEALSNITLFELPHLRWGSKPCQFCQDQRFMHTGITIGCDAGMCRTYFHVTCGQREGLLSDATPSEELVQADPFFAHCKLHSDKNYMRKKKRNWLALQLRTQVMNAKRERECSNNDPGWSRNQRKLTLYKKQYSQLKTARTVPLVPTQKIPRLLTTSASACRDLWRKSELMGIDTTSCEETEALISALQDVPKKWNIPPAFSVEFVGYFLDRDGRVKKLKEQLAHYKEEKERLISEQQSFQETYKSIEAEHAKVLETNVFLKKTIQNYYGIIQLGKSDFAVPDIETLAQPVPSPAASTILSLVTKGNVPTVAALKAGVGFPLRLRQRSSNTPSNISFSAENEPIVLNNKCGICHQSNEPHLLTRCDTCKLYYHLGCLRPPLTRMPKKTKQMGWQCSECDNNTTTSDAERVDTSAPRQLRKDRDFSRSQTFSEDFIFLQNLQFDDDIDRDMLGDDVAPEVNRKSSKKRRREKRRNRYSPELISVSQTTSKHHSRKRKRKNTSTEEEAAIAPPAEQPRQGIKLFIKSVPNPSGQANCTSQFVLSSAPTSTTSTFVAKTEEYVTNTGSPSSAGKQKTTKVIENQCDRCDTCSNIGTNLNMVKCDECSKCFHFGCLDPPVKKSPKVRGYSWHCANCDPTETDSN